MHSRKYDSVLQILENFDIDCACVAFTGYNFYATKRGLSAMKSRSNTVNVAHWGENYEIRLLKYLKRGYSIVDPNFKRSEIMYDSIVSSWKKNVEIFSKNVR